MAETLIGIEDLPTSRFHRRIAFVAAGGPFCDGYLLGIIVVALPFIAQDLALNALQIGLIGAASLIGMFVGGVVFGPMTDRFGRQKMYVLNLAVFVICSLAHLLVHDVTALFVLRFAMGSALGADYPIATALAVEFLPKKLRGPVLASLVLLMWVGYTLSLATGLLVSGSPSSVWRYILASAAIPSALFLLLRSSIPESPRWLISAGRTEDARRIVAQHLGPQVDFQALVAETRLSTSRRGMGFSSIRELLSRGYGRMLLFCSLFWMCQVAPSFAIKTYQPMLLQALGITHPFAGALVIVSFAILGTAIGMYVVRFVWPLSLWQRLPCCFSQRPYRALRPSRSCCSFSSRSPKLPVPACNSFTPTSFSRPIFVLPGWGLPCLRAASELQPARCCFLRYSSALAALPAC
jgi:putative MFS transporter